MAPHQRGISTQVLVWSASFLTAAEVANRPPKLPAPHCLAWKVTAPSRTTSRAPSCCWATATAVFLQNTAWHLEHGAAKHQFSGAQSMVQVCEFSWTRGWLRPQRRELYGCTCTELGPKTYVRCGPECTREHECKDSSDTCYVRDSAESMNSMTAGFENLTKGESHRSGVEKRKGFLEERGWRWVLQKPSALDGQPMACEALPTVTSVLAQLGGRVLQFCDSTECAKNHMSTSPLNELEYSRQAIGTECRSVFA
ncbi:uncharacterized protein [Canis lupus baileyi]|uniref:uncharacterized protein LOC112661656 isoform X3 n=1 Tax=Canis lupus dingo TaxID=286419 RepID=UPI000DC74EE1|nr:uncharacterized protein LOC112661656 isoform X3 [Canis lupus dingo]XP_048960494.1 uncharacterized protein LOC112661656 isoform X3 [Canis lupus dingo]